MMDLNEFLSKSPFVLREQQKDILTRIYNNFDKYKYFIVEAPTGIGKSVIGYMFSKLVDHSLILTNTKLLQDQYKASFKDLLVIKGKSSYRCYVDNDIPVDKSPCSLSGYNCKDKKFCRYYKDCALIEKEPVVLTSYSAFLSNYNFNASKFDTIICDEAHTLEDILVDRQGFKINKSDLEVEYGLSKLIDSSEEKLKYFLAYDNDRKDLVVQSLSILNNLIYQKLEEYEKTLSRYSLDEIDDYVKLELEKRDKLSRLYEKLEHFITNYTGNIFDERNWIIDVISNMEVEIQPLFIGDYFRRFFTPKKKVMFLSASILDISGFIKELGIDMSEVAVIKENPIFDPKRSPIISIPSGSLTYNQIDKSLPKVVANIQKILDEHKNEKGIILSNNYKVTQYIAESLNNSRLLYKNDKKLSNELLIKQHELRPDPTVLLSPSMNTGVDLPDDLARFQIIIKMPYLSLGSKRIKEKSNNDKIWYQVNMIRRFIQSCGRGVRNEKDYCITYVLDSSFYYCMKQNLKYITQIKDRIILNADKFNYEEYKNYIFEN